MFLVQLFDFHLRTAHSLRHLWCFRVSQFPNIFLTIIYEHCNVNTHLYVGPLILQYTLRFFAHQLEVVAL